MEVWSREQPPFTIFEIRNAEFEDPTRPVKELKCEIARARNRSPRQVATLAFGHRMAVPGTAADVAISCSDSISTVPGTGPGVWKDPLDFDAPISQLRSPRGPPLTLFGLFEPDDPGAEGPKVSEVARLPIAP